jgi:hypothetical protein
VRVVAVLVLVLGACGRIAFDPVGDVGGGTGVLPGGGYRKQIKLGSISPTDLVRFPVSVAWSEDDDLARAATEASDLVVTASDGVTPLPREIVSYSSATGELDMWVEVPRIQGGSFTTMYLYYGAARSNGLPLVWPDMYAGVWHMTGSNGMYPDSARGHPATETMVARYPGSTTGMAGKAAEFDGVDDTLAAADPVDGSLDFGVRPFSYGLWVFASATVGTFDEPFHKGGSSTSNPGFDIELGAGNWEALLNDGSLEVSIVFGTESTLTGYWLHLVAVADRANARFRGFLDGVEVAFVSLQNLGSVDATLPISLSRSSAIFNGKIDEVRVYEGALSADWIGAEYTNLADRESLFTIGEEQAL